MLLRSSLQPQILFQSLYLTLCNVATAMTHLPGYAYGKSRNNIYQRSNFIQHPLLKFPLDLLPLLIRC